MLGAIIFYFVQLLILDPFQAEIVNRLARADVPYEVVADVKACAASAGQAITRHASSDPRELASMAFDIWVRGIAPDTIVAAAVPGCGAVVETAKSFLARQSA